MNVISTKDKENPLGMEIRNAILIGTNKEPKLEKNNGDENIINHL